MKIHVKVTVKSGAVKEFDDFDEFLEDIKFWFASGLDYLNGDGDQAHFQKIRDFLVSLDKDGVTVGTFRSGLQVDFTCKKY